MKIYIDNEFKCYVSDKYGISAAVETKEFDGKCAAFIEGCRFIPAGSTWTREDGAVFSGEMMIPWRPWEELEKIQRDYRLAQLETKAQEEAEDAALLLETAADHEYRLCLMELGVSEDDL